MTRLRRFDVAEDSLQDAFLAAARTWPERGVPDNPAAWLLTAAHRRALDRLRREDNEQRRLPLLVTDAVPQDEPDPGVVGDERLRLLFACCHPALSADARAALMLRFVAGLKTAEIARLFLVAEPTMAARLTRAKAKMALAGIPLRQPDAADLPARLDVVLKVVYLLFTEGYRATAGTELTRPRLAAEAIRLGYLLGELLPGEDETVALLALMIFQHARRDARVDHQGRLVRMADQDRGRWRLDEIGRGRELLARLANSEDALATSEDALEAQAPGAEAEAAQAAEGRGATREGAAREGAAREGAAREGAAREGAAREGAAREGDHAARSDYHLQALIAAEHSVAGATDWQRIAQLYAELERRTGSPVVRLNRAVAIAEAGSPEAALSLLEGLDATLPANHFVPTARAELLLKIGRRAEAASAFDEALRLVRTDIERAHLERRRAEL